MAGAVRIADIEPGQRVLGFDLAELLGVLRPHAATLRWVLTNVDEVAEQPCALAEASWQPGGVRADYPALRELGETVQQTLEGRFVGYLDGSDRPQLSLEAIRGSYWIVWAAHDEVLDLLREAFQEVSDYPEPPPASRSG